MKVTIPNQQQKVLCSIGHLVANPELFFRFNWYFSGNLQVEALQQIDNELVVTLCDNELNTYKIGLENAARVTNYSY